MKFCLVAVIAAMGVAHTAAAPPSQEPPAQRTLRVDVELVTVPVVVMGEKGQLYTGLQQDNFTVLEDGVKQPITNFSNEEAPLTIVLLLEYSGRIRYLRGEVVRPAGIFVSQIMGADDYAAIVAYDMRPHVMTDFTRNRQELLDAVRTLTQSPPGLNESNLFDAVRFVVQGGTVEEIEYKGLDEVEGRTGVLLVASGLDTFSKITFDEARKVVANAGVPIYAIGIGELAYIRAERVLSGPQRLTFLQAQNTLRTLAEESGGRFYSVRFEGALDSVLESVATMLRFQYTLGYKPAKPPADGEKREIKVLVDVDGDGQPDNDRLTVQYRKAYYASRK